MNVDPITWRRLRDIFGNPKPVWKVTEQQFDNADEKLQELGRTPHDQIEFRDLWYYHLDLAYVDLQPELFAHLFPVCLMDWHLSLLDNNATSHGAEQFHYGIVNGNVLEKMLTPKQQTKISEFFLDSILYRMDQERGFKYEASKTPAYGWMQRLNSLGLFLSTLPEIWKEWWEVETAGRAVCLLQYCSGLMYFEGENPLFDAYTCEQGGGGPYLWEHDSAIYDRGWRDGNVQFIREFVTTERVEQSILCAVKRLSTEPEAETSNQIASDLDERLDVIDSHVTDLPRLLAIKNPQGWFI